MRSLLTTLAITATLLGPAVAVADDMSTMTGMAAPGAGAADAAYAASMTRMMAGMHTKPTGDPDRDFVSMMMPHHQGAIDMARVELTYGKDPMLRKLAEDIVSAQEREIAEMKTWQDRNGK